MSKEEIEAYPDNQSPEALINELIPPVKLNRARIHDIVKIGGFKCVVQNCDTCFNCIGKTDSRICQYPECLSNNTFDHLPHIYVKLD